VTRARSKWRARVSRHFAYAAVLGLSGLSRAAGARGANIAVVGPRDNPVVLELAQELRAAGFVVKAEIADAARSPPAVTPDDETDIVIRVDAATIEVWAIAEPPGLSTLVDVVPVGSSTNEAAIAARRAEEVVRARLLPVDHSPAFETASATPQVPTPPSAASSPPLKSSTQGSDSPPGSSRPTLARFGLDVGTLLSMSPGGIPPAAELLLLPRWIPTKRIMARTIVGVPLTSPEIKSAEGQASIKEWFFGAAVDWNFLPAEAAWSANAGAGLAGVRLQSQGTANPPFVSSTGDAWGWLPFVDGGLSHRFGSSQIGLGLDAWIGASLPRMAIAFPTRRVATWGSPWAGVSLALKIDAF